MSLARVSQLAVSSSVFLFPQISASIIWSLQTLFSSLSYNTRSGRGGVQGCLIGANLINLPESAIYWCEHSALCRLLIVNSAISVNCGVEQGQGLLAVRQWIAPSGSGISSNQQTQDILKSANRDILISANRDIQKATLELSLVRKGLKGYQFFC